MTTVTAIRIHCHVTICALAIILCHTVLTVVRSSIETIVLVVVSALIGNEYLGVCIVEMPSFIVRVHCECPTTCMPSYRTIEVSQAHILVELPAVQHIAKVSSSVWPSPVPW